MKKALLVTTVSGFVPQFEMNNVAILQNIGFEVHYAANYKMPSYGKDNRRLEGTGIIKHQIDFVRSPFKKDNFRVYHQLKSLMKKEKFDLIHCHTPMGGVMARLTAHRTGTAPVIYTAHGFHFFKGAPIKNWLMYYPMEKFLSKYTDQQICINQEDYILAQKSFHAKYIDYIPGVGIDLSAMTGERQADRAKKRKELGIAAEKIVLLSVGELIKRKNHETMIRAIAASHNQNLIYVISGQGELDEGLRKQASDLKVEKQILFLGYRKDIDKIYHMADIFVFPSYQEGLPRALLEAMACGLPVICSDIRGSKDLMVSTKKEKDGCLICEGGLMVKKANDWKAYVMGIKYLENEQKYWPVMGKKNMDRAAEFGINKVGSLMEKIYQRWI